MPDSRTWPGSQRPASDNGMAATDRPVPETHIPLDTRRSDEDRTDLEREASASSRIAVSVPGPGRATEQGIDAGAGCWAGAADSAAERRGPKVDPVAGPGPVSSRSARRGRVMHAMEDVD